MAVRSNLWIAAVIVLTVPAAPLWAQNSAGQYPPNTLRNGPAAGGAQPGGGIRTVPPGQGMPPLTGNPNSGGTLANGAPAQPQVLPLAPPFVLSPQEQADLDRFLLDWEKRSEGIKTFECIFHRREYNQAYAKKSAADPGNPNQPITDSTGDLKYAAPDKGLFRVTKLTSYVLDQKTQDFVPQEGGQGEYWTCDGNSTFVVDHQKKQIIETPLPPELRGKAITDGPLPFVFGAKASSLKQRYFLRVITPPDEAKTSVWLEARPKLQKDAVNFSRVKLILSKPDLQPSAIQIDNPGSTATNQSRTVITFEQTSVNSPAAAIRAFFKNFGRPSILGYTLVVQQNLAPPTAPPVNPNVTPTSGQVVPGQASRGQQPKR